MRFCVLASGSGGNACYVETDHARVLVDAGLSGRELAGRLEAIGVDPARINGIVITHEHADHIRGAGPFSRRFRVPLFLNRKTRNRSMDVIGDIETPLPLTTGMPVAIHDLTIETFTKCHDAADPIGLVLSCDGTRIGLITDLGRSTRLVEDRLRGCRALIIEFNHDVDMLEQGPYPLALKRRIRGPEGHLSNDEGAALLESLAHEDLDHVVLAHLSEINNDPQRALDAALGALDRRGRANVNLQISLQNEPCPVIAI
jgi:phosphoribosyl 1,2-cyclic phosphodiesterase